VDETWKSTIEESEGEEFAWLLSLKVIIHKDVWRKKQK